METAETKERLWDKNSNVKWRSPPSIAARLLRSRSDQRREDGSARRPRASFASSCPRGELPLFSVEFTRWGGKKRTNEREGSFITLSFLLSYFFRLIEYFFGFFYPIFFSLTFLRRFRSPTTTHLLALFAFSLTFQQYEPFREPWNGRMAI